MKKKRRPCETANTPTILRIQRVIPCLKINRNKRKKIIKKNEVWTYSKLPLSRPPLELPKSNWHKIERKMPLGTKTDLKSEVVKWNLHVSQTFQITAEAKGGGLDPVKRDTWSSPLPRPKLSITDCSKAVPLLLFLRFSVTWSPASCFDLFKIKICLKI